MSATMDKICHFACWLLSGSLCVFLGVGCMCEDDIHSGESATENVGFAEGVNISINDSRSVEATDDSSIYSIVVKNILERSSIRDGDRIVVIGGADAIDGKHIAESKNMIVSDISDESTRDLRADRCGDENLANDVSEIVQSMISRSTDREIRPELNVPGVVFEFTFEVEEFHHLTEMHPRCPTLVLSPIGYNMSKNRAMVIYSLNDGRCLAQRRLVLSKKDGRWSVDYDTLLLVS